MRNTQRPVRPPPRTSSCFTQIDDAQLLDAWRCGDAKAGGALLGRHLHALEGALRNRVSPGHLADLVQETFTIVIERRNQIRDGHSFRAYLLSVAYSVFCKHVSKIHCSLPTVVLDDVSVQSLEPSASSIIAQAQEHRLLHEGLLTISTKHQSVLELYYWEQLSTQEIARVLGVPSGTIRTRLQRARHALEAAMASIERAMQWLDCAPSGLEDGCAHPG